MPKDVIRVVAAVIEDEGRYLITQRTASAVLPLKWEFPGGRIEEGETESQALGREVKWRLGVDVEVVEKLGEHIHEYEHYEVLMSMFACHITDGQTPRPVNVHDVRWVTSADLGDYEFPPADEGTMDKLLGLMRN
jgi:8-oxo-dGTP diphosphatase